MKKLLVFLLCTSYDCLAAAADPQESNFLAQKQYESCMKYIAALNLSSPEYKIVVELGCSTAKMSHELAQRYPEKLFIAIDCDEKAITYATERCEDQANVVCINDTVQMYDLQTYNLPMANLATCYHLLHWIEHNELPTVFTNIARNLALHGIVDISTPTKQEECCITRATQDTLLFEQQWDKYSLPFLAHATTAQENISYITIEELTKLATDAHLQVLLCEKQEESYQFRSHHEFRSFLHSCLKHYGLENCMSKRVQSTFVKDIAKRYCENYNRSENKELIEYRFFSLHLTAQKIES
jgi:trans-aconitate methyltransferase